MSDAHNEHESLIKTPKQLIAAVVAGFAVPILIIVLLVHYVGSAPKTGAGSNSQSPEAIAERLKPVADEGFTLAAAGGARAYREPELVPVRQRIGMVFQQFNLFPHMSVSQNVSTRAASLSRAYCGACSANSAAALRIAVRGRCGTSSDAPPIAPATLTPSRSRRRGCGARSRATWP